MGGVSATVYRGITRYWRRKGYERLNGSLACRGRKSRAVELGVADGSSRRRRFWRIKLTPKLKLKLRFTPKKFLCGLRDAYVNMMMKLANTRMISNGFAGGYAGDGATGFGMRPIKEYDERMIVEIYKSIIMAQGQLMPPELAPGLHAYDPQPDWSFDNLLSEIDTIEKKLNLEVTVSDSEEEVEDSSMVVGTRFSCDEFYMSDDSKDKILLGIPCLMNKVGLVQGALS
ncbi:unnamed protein product [Fraxinus pennsylvanica]|uniref:Uncharacterized protein n=1 Tax=Fraxinus pennsylvanica TaxID=56036 RepID=A0AAD2AI70_9LAMI|nr:unnamed protein product [Fraxinus pennsylvanica]